MVRAMKRPPAVVVINLICGLAIGLSASTVMFNRETLALQKNHTSELNLLVLQTRVALDLLKQGQQEIGELTCLKLAVHRIKGKL